MLTSPRHRLAVLFAILCTPAAFGQQVYLKASNSQVEDQFGWSSAVSGNTLVVGARYEDGGIAGVNGDAFDNSAFNAGAVYVFVDAGLGWVQQAYLKASNPDDLDLFGTSVAIDGDTLVVGARREAGSVGGVDGDQGDNGADSAGAAYVFVRNGTTWTQQAYLKAAHPDPDDLFGSSVALSGDTLIVGAPAEDGSDPGVDGDSSDNGLPGSGAAFVFVRKGTTWSQQAYLKASNPGNFHDFGWSLGVSGDTVVVGSRRENGAGTGVDADQLLQTAPIAGAAYVFVRNGTTWSQQAYLKASNTDAGDVFGISAGVSGDTIVVGAYREASSATGVNGDASDDSAFDTGAAYVFVRNGASWSQQAYLKPSNGEARDQFGRSVAISGERVLVGARREKSSASGIAADQGDNNALDAGAAYLYKRSGTTWAQQLFIKPPNTSAGDFFGGNVALGGTVALVGSPFEDSVATGVGGLMQDDSSMNAGAAHVLDVKGPWYDLGYAQAGTHGDPVLTGFGRLAPFKPAGMTLTGALENAPFFLFVGFETGYASFEGGTLVPSPNPPGLVIPAVTDGGGDLTLRTTWPSGVPVGFSVFAQAWVVDPAAASGYAASNAVLGVTP